MQKTDFNTHERRYDVILGILKSLKKQQEEQKLLQKDILDFGEACAVLNVSSSLLYKLSSKGVIPSSKPNGKKLYFKRTDLNDWMLSKQSKSTSELEKEADDWINSNSLNDKP